MAIVSSERGRLISELCIFLVIAFGATFLLEIAGIGMYGSKILSSRIPSVVMFIPAITAIICLVYFKSTVLTRETKLFLACFMISAGFLIFEILFYPVLGTYGPYPILSVVASFATLLLVVILNLKDTWRTNLESAKLSIGKNPRQYVILPVIFSLAFIFALFLSYRLGLRLPLVEFSLNLFFATAGFSVITLAISWPIYFGEEYGWRFYLQDRLFALFGAYTGLVLVGLVWGLWHAPLMLMGMNFPNEPFLPANIVYLVYTIIMSVIFGYAVLKTGSIWIAVLLHGLTDIIVNTGRVYISGADTIVSFLPLLVILGIFALVLLRSGVWTSQKTGSENDRVNS
ncbi:MAG: type II CAAX endopeptidase family protein [Methanomicrobiales archaeon]